MARVWRLGHFDGRVEARHGGGVVVFETPDDDAATSRLVETLHGEASRTARPLARMIGTKNRAAPQVSC